MVADSPFSVYAPILPGAGIAYLHMNGDGNSNNTSSSRGSTTSNCSADIDFRPDRARRNVFACHADPARNSTLPTLVLCCKACRDEIRVRQQL